MFFFIVLLSIVIGLAASSCYYLFIPLGVIFIIFVFRRFNKYLGILVLLIIPANIGISYICINDNKPIYQGIVIESKDNYFLFQSGLGKYYVYSKDNSYEIGDVLSLTGYLKSCDFEVLESSFDFNNYLAKKGIINEIKVTDVNENFLNPIRIRTRRKEFLSHFSNDEIKSIIGSILFGELIDSNITETTKGLHLTKILSSSGLYLSLFIRFIEFFLKKRLSNHKSKIIAYTLLFPYFIFVFPKIAVIRLILIFILYLLNHYALKERLDRLSIISLASLFMLLFDFHYVYQTGFLLSTFISIFIYFLNGSFLRVKVRKRKLLNFGILSLFLLPLEIYFYSSLSPLCNIYSILLNILLYPLAIISLLCFYKIPLYSVSEFIANGYINVLNFLKPITFEIYIPKFHPLLYLFYYSLLIFGLYLLSIRYKPLMKIPFVLLTSVLVLYALPINNSFTNQVSFLNVGQGDSILIRNKNQVALIDTGGLTYKDVATDVLIPYFKNNRIYSLDYVFITHDDEDHMGALESLNNNFKIKNIIKDDKYFPIKMGDITFNNLNTYIDTASDDNDKSLVISFNIFNVKFLCMGDASTNIEKKLLEDNKDIKCDVLKVGHHGSDTSSSYTFLEKANPKDAIISVGKNNKYKHPNDKVLQRLNKLKINVMRTDKNSTINYYF